MFFRFLPNLYIYIYICFAIPHYIPPLFNTLCPILAYQDYITSAGCANIASNAMAIGEGIASK
jgi:hypothetical protein